MKIDNILKGIWNEFIYGGHFHSIGVVSIVFVSSLVLNTKITWDFLVIVYLGIHSAYLYNRFKEFKTDFMTNPERTGYIEKYVKKIPFIILLSFLIIISILFYFENFLGLFFAIFIFIIGLLYSELFKDLTKKILGFKNFFIPLLFSSLIIFLVIYYSLSWNLALVLIFIFSFLRVFSNTIFFDIKDIESDKKENLLTLPIVFGKTGVFHFLSFINVLSSIPIILGVFLKILPQFSIALLLTIPYSFYYIEKSKKPGANFNFLSYVFADGEYVFWSFFAFLGKIFL